MNYPSCVASLHQADIQSQGASPKAAVLGFASIWQRLLKPVRDIDALWKG